MLASPCQWTEGGKPAEGDETAFHWCALVPFCIHPLRVATIEALLWVGTPLSATDLKKLFDEEGKTVGLISYHVNELAKMGVLKEVRNRQVRGVTETFYKIAFNG